MSGKRYVCYPGCSLKGTAKAYEESLRAVFEALGTELEELEDWNCCGATAYMSIDETAATGLAARNLALAERDGADVIAPCNACYLVLLKAQRRLQEEAALRDRVTRRMAGVGLSYRGTARVRHPLDVLVNDIGPGEIARKVTAPLRGVSVAPYYGCQVVRPYALFDSQDDPTTMDRLLAAAGAKVVPYRYKTRCCGGSQTGTLPEIGLDCVRALLKEAVDQGADLIATTCPLCQFNLEAHQREIRRRSGLPAVPVVYFTQILGLALGVPGGRLGLRRSIVPAEPVLAGRAIHAG
jgi:heterodisulfide reductase subunit B